MLMRGDPVHWRDESREGLRGPTQPVLPATSASPPVPGSARIVIFSPHPGAPRHPNPRPLQAARPAKNPAFFANRAGRSASV